MVMCDVYLLYKKGKDFTLKGKELIRENVVLTRRYAEEKNDKWQENGLWHEIKEDETKAYYEQGRKKVEARKKKERAKARLGDILTDVVDKGSEILEVDNSDVPDDELTMTELRVKYPTIKATKKVDFLAKVKLLNKDE